MEMALVNQQFFLICFLSFSPPPQLQPLSYRDYTLKASDEKTKAEWMKAISSSHSPKE